MSFAAELREPALAGRPEFATPSLIDWMGMSTADWVEFSRRSPIKRTKRRGFLRNVAVALGNSRDPAAVPALSAALSDDEPLVRGHAAWALGKIACTAAIDALAAKLDFEAEPSVIAELRSALAAPERGPPH